MKQSSPLSPAADPCARLAAIRDEIASAALKAGRDPEAITRDAVREFERIDTLDRPRLADALDAAAQTAGRLPGLLVQVNIGDEAQKAGVARAAADQFIESCKSRFGDRLLGLMCIPPAAADPRRHFALLAAMARDHDLRTLSLGMSADFRLAIAAGATEVRIGSALFGERS